METSAIKNAARKPPLHRFIDPPKVIPHDLKVRGDLQSFMDENERNHHPRQFFVYLLLLVQMPNSTSASKLIWSCSAMYPLCKLFNPELFYFIFIFIIAVQ